MMDGRAKRGWATASPREAKTRQSRGLQSDSMGACMTSLTFTPAPSSSLETGLLHLRTPSGRLRNHTRSPAGRLRNKDLVSLTQL